MHDPSEIVFKPLEIALKVNEKPKLFFNERSETKSENAEYLKTQNSNISTVVGCSYTKPSQISCESVETETAVH